MTAETNGTPALSEIERLINIEQIRELKARYWRAVDDQRWADVPAHFTSEEAPIKLRMHFPDGRPILTVRDFRDFCAGPYYQNLRSLHMGYNWLIEFTSPTEAEGLWKFGAVEYPPAANPMGSSATRHVWGYHRDRYVKTDAGWRIAFTDYNAVTGTFTRFPAAEQADKWRSSPEPSEQPS